MARLNLSWKQVTRLPSWLVEPKNFWLFTVGLVVASLVGDWAGEFVAEHASRQDRIRYSGWILDTLGLASIAVGISNKLDRFKGKTLFRYTWDTVKGWLRACPLLMQDRTIHAGTAHLKLSPAQASGFGTVKINPDRPIEEKVEWLLERYYALVDVVHDLRRDLDTRKSELDKRIQGLEKALGKL